MRTLRYALAVAMGLLIAAGLSLTAASPAQAAPPASCTNSSFCGYGHQNYSTEEGYELTPFYRAGLCEPTALRNSYTSLYNNSGRTVRVYKSNNCSGEYLTYYNGTGVTNIFFPHPTWNDNIESLKYI